MVSTDCYMVQYVQSAAIYFLHLHIIMTKHVILYLWNGTEIEDTLVLNVFHVCEYIRDMKQVEHWSPGIEAMDGSGGTGGPGETDQIN